MTRTRASSERRPGWLICTVDDDSDLLAGFEFFGEGEHATLQDQDQDQDQDAGVQKIQADVRPLLAGRQSVLSSVRRART